MKITTRVMLAVGLVGVLGGMAPMVGMAQSGKSPIVGVWHVAERTTTGPTAGTNANPQPSLFLFTARHYSILTVNSDTPRPDLPQQGATDKQRADAWGPFTANAGTYAIKGNELTNTVLVAKNPNVMKSGGVQVFTFKMDGKNTLSLTQKANQNGPVANPTTFKLTRVE
jgi:hypothetical protein